MNEEEHALLTACVADPTDDLPRRVYADWLDEHNQPARAEFVRLSVYAADPSHDAKSRAANQSRADELLAAHRDDWDRALTDLGAADIPIFSHMLPVEYDRGLPVGVKMPLDFFMRNGAAVRVAAPTVTRLDLTMQLMGDAAIERLAGSPHLAGYTELNLTNNQLGSASASALAASPFVAQLKSLDFHMNRRIGGLAGTTALRGSPNFPPDMMIVVEGFDPCRFDEFQQQIDERLRRPGSVQAR